MSIAIAGAGLSGAYLYRRLVAEGFKDIDLFDVKKTTACGCRPCAWGFAPSDEIVKMLEKVTDPSRFILHHSEIAVFDSMNIPSDLLTIDKPALIDELVGDTEIKIGEVDLNKYDKVVDATGVSRAYLPPIKDDFIAECKQYRLKTEEPLGFWFRTSSVGYEWCFPLGGGEYHVGFGNLKSEVGSYKPRFVMDENAMARVRCRCQSTIRLTAPFYSQPFVADGKIIGIGECIGAVAPLVADGNLYAMQTGEMLLDNWDDLGKYSEKVLERYDWMRTERKGLEKLMEGKIPSLREIMTMKRHANKVGVKMNSIHVLKLFQSMSKH
jgi:flavin-dependent dehydrogenase